MWHLFLTAALAAQAVAPPVPAFDAVSIKRRPEGPDGSTIRARGGFIAPNLPVRNLIMFAYGLRGVEVVGGPDWLATDRYDILARADSNPPPPQLRLMLQAMLVERFQFKSHQERREIQGYRLVVAQPGRLGPQLQAGADCALGAARPNGPCGLTFGGQIITGRGAPIANLAMFVEGGVGGPVTDATGLAAFYDYELRWNEVGAATPAAGDPPNIFTALQEQLGLKLEPIRVPVDVLVIDSIERPTEN